MVPAKGSFGWVEGLEALEQLSGEFGDDFEVLNFDATRQRVGIKIRVPYDVTTESWAELREYFAGIINPMGGEHIWLTNVGVNNSVTIEFTIYNREKGYFKRV